MLYLESLTIKAQFFSYDPDDKSHSGGIGDICIEAYIRISGVSTSNISYH